MRTKPSELKAVAALLLEPAEDVDALAMSVLEAINAAREGGNYFAVVPEQPRDLAFFQGYGFFSTRGEAERTAAKVLGSEASYRLVRVRPWGEWAP